MKGKHQWDTHISGSFEPNYIKWKTLYSFRKFLIGNLTFRYLVDGCLFLITTQTVSRIQSESETNILYYFKYKTNIIILTMFINFYVCFCNKPRSQKSMVYLKLFSSLRNGVMRQAYTLG